ncbi:ABC transporter permease [Streptococcus entericus]|uniref:ABC transporter permease n=1 Tax=Streptococcus entericus TaxID=155680 RepID=UPI00037B34C5|nr:ABC transporter permease [Streptococcus entericus]
MNLFSKENRILLREMVKTDFKLRYQGSVIGHLWSILKPMMLFSIMYVVFIRFLRMDDGTPHNAIGVLFGMVTWNFFAEATNMGMMSIVSRGDLLRKLNFPKEIIVLSAVVGAAINYSINLLVVLVFTLLNGVTLSWSVLVLVPLFLELFVLALGLALMLSSLFVKYRDIGPVWEVIMQAGMYATPVIYSLNFFLQRENPWTPLMAKVMMLNPMAQIIQDIRHFIVYSGSFRGWQLYDGSWLGLVSYLLPVLVLVIGSAIFKKEAKRFAEIL